MPFHSGWLDRGLPAAAGATLFLLGWAVPPRVDAQAPPGVPLPAQRHSLSLEAQSVANGGASQVVGGNGVPIVADTFAIQSASDRRVASNQTNLKISVRNLSTVLDTVRVEWFFVALPLNEAPAGSHEIIFHHDAQTLAIPGGKTATQVVGSPEVQAVYERSTTLTTVPTGSYYGGYTSTLSAATVQKGLTIRGWMVRLVSTDGAVLAAKGSSQTYEDIAANSAKLAGMLSRPGSTAANPPAARDGGPR